MNLIGIIKTFIVVIAVCFALWLSYKFFIIQKFKKEIWLPVVNKSGKVCGKVAYSLSKISKNTFRHPVVRIALIYKGKLFLKRRPSSAMNDAHKIDYPFERFLRFNESLDEAVKQTLLEQGAKEDLPYHYLFKYRHNTEKTNRLVYFYICNIRDEKLLNKIDLSDGRWWATDGIREKLYEGFFSEFFENEFEFLSNTVLKATSLMEETE
jgi:hypothetical protein